MIDEIFYVLKDNDIIFSGSAADCKRIVKLAEGARIEPPLVKRHRSIQSQFDFTEGRYSQ